MLGRSISARSVRLLTFKAHDVRVTFPGIGWSRYALASTVAFGAHADVIGVLLGYVDEDADDVGAVDDIDRRGAPG